MLESQILQVEKKPKGLFLNLLKKVGKAVSDYKIWTLLVFESFLKFL